MAEEFLRAISGKKRVVFEPANLTLGHPRRLGSSVLGDEAGAYSEHGRPVLGEQMARRGSRMVWRGGGVRWMTISFKG